MWIYKHMEHIKEYEDYKGLLRDMQGLGLSLSEEELEMAEFIKITGELLEPEDFEEYLYDYSKNPEEFGFDVESDEYITIENYYSEISSYSKFNLDGPMKTGNAKRWNIDGIENSDLYKMYLKIYKHMRK